MSTGADSVHWHEGMFLTPHHFQAADRRNACLRQLGSQWDNHYNWGVRAIEIDADALANHRFVVRRLRARMPDGELLSFPEDATLPVLDLQTALRNDESTLVYLALPLERPSRGSTAGDAGDVAARRVIESRDLQDENTGEHRQTVQILRPNARLLVASDDLSGYVALPIAGVRRSESSTGAPTIDPAFIPPVLACDAWPPLHQGVLGRLLARIEKKAAMLASQVNARQIRFESQGPGERLMLEQLCEVHAAAAVLRVDTSAQGVSPLTAYRELARIVGRLSIFALQQDAPSLPPYDHDNLGGCFLAARGAIEDLLDCVTHPGYEERPFIADELLLRVDLDGRWLSSGRSLYLGVQSSLPGDEVQRLLASGRNIKFGCGKRAETLFLLGQAGLQPQRVVHAPRALPVRKGMQYYTLQPDQAPEEWRHVVRSLTLAARLSEQLLIDDLTEHDAVVLDVDGKSATLKLSVFAVEDETAGLPIGAEEAQQEPATVS